MGGIEPPMNRLGSKADALRYLGREAPKMDI